MFDVVALVSKLIFIVLLAFVLISGVTNFFHGKLEVSESAKWIICVTLVITLIISIIDII